MASTILVNTISPYTGTTITVTPATVTFSGVILKPDGTTGAPSDSWTSEPTLGWRRSATGTSAFRSAGIDVMTLRSGAQGSILMDNNVTISNGTLDLTATNTFLRLGGDVVLTRDAANTLAQRNGTNLQTSRLYNTFTDASNYQRTQIYSDTNGTIIADQAAGTGTAKRVQIETGGSIRWFCSATGILAAATDNTYDIGVAGATRPRTQYLGTDLYVGNNIRGALLSKDTPIVNGVITASVGSNALTLALKTFAGADASAADPIFILFPSTTLTSASYDVVKVTGALSVVVSSGSTLGHANATANHFFVYAINNAGTAELAVSNLPPDYPGTFANVRKVTTVAEGGAGAADSATVVYSTTARSNVVWTCLAKALSTQTTAGTWAAVPTQLDMAPFNIPGNAFSADWNGTNHAGFNQNVTTKLGFDHEAYDFDAVYDAVTNFRYQPNVAGLYDVGMGFNFTNVVGTNYASANLQKNGSSNKSSFTTASVSTTCGAALRVQVLMNGTTDYLEAFATEGDGTANRTMNGQIDQTFFEGRRISDSRN